MHFFWHGGAEKQGLSFFGNIIDYLVNIFYESHLKHLVNLIKDKKSYVPQVYCPSSYVVKKSSWCCDNNFCPFQSFYLFFHSCSAVYCGCLKLHRLSESLKSVFHLHTKLSCRCKYQCLNTFSLYNLVYYRYAECYCLSGSRD